MSLIQLAVQVIKDQRWAVCYILAYHIVHSIHICVLYVLQHLKSICILYLIYVFSEYIVYCTKHKIYNVLSVLFLKNENESKGRFRITILQCDLSH